MSFNIFHKKEKKSLDSSEDKSRKWFGLFNTSKGEEVEMSSKPILESNRIFPSELEAFTLNTVVTLLLSSNQRMSLNENENYFFSIIAHNVFKKIVEAIPPTTASNRFYDLDIVRKLIKDKMDGSVKKCIQKKKA
jgi:hypothetical protein